MFSPDPVRAQLPLQDAELDAYLATLPEQAAVFLLHLGHGQQPYLGRSVNLRRRLKRVLRPAGKATRSLSLRGLASGVAYWPSGSALEANLVLLEQARAHFPGHYRRMLRLRFPSYIRLLTANRFPRVVVTRQVADLRATFGPFLHRSEAEEFAGRALDLFLLRRCEEDLFPSPDHPGCIYGEMKLCLRPCQAAVSDARYLRESEAFLRFLTSGGASLREELEAERAAASDKLDFEAAARAHKRLRKADECWRGAPALRGVLSRLHGAAITADIRPGAVRLWPVRAAVPGRPVCLPLEDLGGAAIAARLGFENAGDISSGAAGLEMEEAVRESLAVFTKWAASSWCDGEWVKFGEHGEPPARKIANAARRVHERRWAGTGQEG